MTAREIKALRTRMNITQLDLANLLHTTTHTVSRWENGRGRPQRHFRYRLEEIARTYRTATGSAN